MAIVTLETWTMRLVQWIAATIGVVAISTMFITLLTATMTRYLLGGGLVWATDVTSLLFPWAALAGVVLAHQHSAHIAVQLVTATLPSAIARVLAIMVHVLIVATCSYLLFQAQTVLQITAAQRLPVIGVPLSMAYLSLPCAMGAVVIVSVVRIMEAFRNPDFAEPDSVEETL